MTQVSVVRAQVGACMVTREAILMAAADSRLEGTVAEYSKATIVRLR